MMRVVAAARNAVLALAGLAMAGCPLDGYQLQIADPVFSGGKAILTIELGSSYLDDTLQVWVDGELFDGPSERTETGAIVRVPVRSGPSHVRAAALFELPQDEAAERAVTRRAHARRIEGPPGAPGLLASSVPSGSTNVVRTAWLALDFDGTVAPETQATFELRCDDDPAAFALGEIDPTALVVNPAPELPSAASCILAWQAPHGPETLEFSTAGTSPDTASVLYDRAFGNLALFTPFPDDFWLVPDPSQTTDHRVDLPAASRPPDVVGVVNAFRPGINQLDGFSPTGAIVLEVSHAPDTRSLPMSPEASLDPIASIGLFDLTPGSPTHGQRVPFQLSPRSDFWPAGSTTNHALVLHPSVPLTPMGRYGVIVTRQAFADSTRPFGLSSFMALSLSQEWPEGIALARTRALTLEVLDAVAAAAVLPIPEEDLAVAVRVSVRSMDDLPEEMLAIKDQVLALPPPMGRTTDCTRCACGVESHPYSTDVAAIVTGEWDAPVWRSGQLFLARDSDGLPRVNGTQKLCFTLALPMAAQDDPVPVTMYQHGNPGSAEFEVPSYADWSGHAAAGFALAGFTDVSNREFPDLGSQILATFGGFIANSKWPELWLTTRAEQLSFVRMLQELELDVLPLGVPDGISDVDPGAPLTYVGISAGAIHGQMLMTYAPEIRAGALVVGGRRFGEDLFHQDTTGIQPLLPIFLGFFPNLKPADLWVGLSMVQMLFDPQDGHNHASRLYRDPIEVVGTTDKPSVLVIEGLRDSYIANNGTRSLAWTMGPIPHLAPEREPVPYLDLVDGPVQGNIDPVTTAAYVQFDCGLGQEGHFCAQVDPDSLQKRLVFFESALSEAAPKIEAAGPLQP